MNVLPERFCLVGINQFNPKELFLFMSGWKQFVLPILVTSHISASSPGHLYWVVSTKTGFACVIACTVANGLLYLQVVGKS